jgi:hypothetical protein
MKPETQKTEPMSIVADTFRSWSRPSMLHRERTQPPKRFLTTRNGTTFTQNCCSIFGEIACNREAVLTESHTFVPGLVVLLPY